MDPLTNPLVPMLREGPHSPLGQAFDAWLACGIPRNTQRAYAAQVIRWWLFCNHIPNAPTNIRDGFNTMMAIGPPAPAKPADLAFYVMHLANSGASLSTVTQALAAIGRWHLWLGLEDPRDSNVVKLARAAAVRQLRTRPARQLDACTPDILLQWVRAVRLWRPRNSISIAAHDSLMLLMCWWAGLRRSELVALRWEDVGCFDSEGLIVKIRGSKTNDATVDVDVPMAMNVEICAVRAWKEWWMLERGKWDPDAADPRLHDHVFMRGAEGFRNLVKRTADDAKTPGTWGPHSLRSGLATTMARGEKGMPDIMRAGRWASAQTVTRYVRRAQLLSEHTPTRGIA